jgi:hypothetical protein
MNSVTVTKIYVTLHHMSQLPHDNVGVILRTVRRPRKLIRRQPSECSVYVAMYEDMLSTGTR